MKRNKVRVEDRVAEALMFTSSRLGVSPEGLLEYCVREQLLCEASDGFRDFKESPGLSEDLEKMVSAWPQAIR